MHVPIFSPYISHSSHGTNMENTNMENTFNNQGLFKLVIISFILMTLVFVSAGSAILRINYLPVTVSEG